MALTRDSILPTLLTLAIALAASSLALARDAERRVSDAGANLAAEEAYLAQNDTAMTKMMAGMAVKPTGDVDHDFVAMMVPHHQGAIDMAMAVLRFGHNETIRRLAQEIIVTQQQEIAVMLGAAGEPLPPSIPSPTQPPSPHGSAVPTNANIR
jgi:uncharacterized protein (DUF305 family)